MADIQTTKRKQRLNYACGMNASSVKKMCTFIFGEYFHSLKINTDDRCFDIFMHKQLEGVTFVEKFGQEYIDYFNEFWSEVPGFKVKYYLGLNIEDL